MPPKFLYKYTFTGIEPADLALYRAMLYPLYQRVRRFYVYVYKNYTKYFIKNNPLIEQIMNIIHKYNYEMLNLLNSANRKTEKILFQCL